MARARYVTLADPPRLDDRPAGRRIGLIALATDHTSERDFARLRPSDDIAIYVSRIAYANPTTRENLLEMQPRLSDAARLILPGESLDAIAYSCTAAAMYIGEETVAKAVRAAKPGVPVVTPVSAALAAFEVLEAARLSLLTPYSRRVTAAMAEFFEGRGLEVVSTACFGLEDDREMARVAPASIVAAAREVISPEAEALFISCTALRAAEVAGAIEAAIAKPVVTSNQAMVWLALRRAGWIGPIDGHGRLLHLAAPVPSA
jgi:maleate isomerase